MMANKKMKIILMNKVNCKQMTVGTWELFYILLLSVTADELRVPRPLVVSTKILYMTDPCHESMD